MGKELTNQHILEGVCENDFIMGSELKFPTYGNVMYLSEEEYEKTYFLVYLGKLRQFRIKKSIVFPFNYGIGRKGSRYKYDSVVVIEVAGIGTLIVGSTPFSFYKSVEDYKNGKEHKPSYCWVSGQTIEKLYGLVVCNYNICSKTEDLRRWYWTGTCAKARNVEDKIPVCFICDANGLYFPDGWSPKSISGYATKEECEADNAISVCCFDEEQPAEKTEKIVRLSVGIKESDIKRLKEFVRIVY